MKKFLIPCLAVIAVAAIVFCFVFNGQKGDLQKQLDEAKAEVTKATDNAKAEVEKAVADAKAEAEKAVADAKAEAEKTIADAKAEAEAKIADLEGQLTEAKKAAEEAQAKVTELEEKLAAATAGAAVDEKSAEEKPAETAEEKSADTAEEKPAEEVKVMTHEEYMAAEVDSEVVIESYVQDHQAWWDNKVTVYLQSPDGAYFAYEMVCSEEDAAKLVKGQKIRVKGYKTEWSGEVEIASGCTFEFVEGDSFVAEAQDVTALLGKDELKDHMNEYIVVKDAVIADKKDGAAFLYNYDGSGQEGQNNDLYYDVIVNGQTYTFVVESYLRGQDTDVYKTVEGLKVGDTVDVEGFLYWYEGPQPQTTKVTVK